MPTNANLLLEGSYLYFQDEVNYSQENFKLFQFTEGGGYLLQSEILSRLDTGEFLKVIANLQMNQNYIPIGVKTERSIGNRYAMEEMSTDSATQTLTYRFQDSSGSEQNLTKPHNTKHYLTSPSVATAAIFSLSKRFDATGCTPVTLITTTNYWDFESPPTEKLIFAEFQGREAEELKINNQLLAATHLRLFDHDHSTGGAERPVDLYLSKHFAIPYQLTHGNLRVSVKSLRRLT
jgi:hypothetical protein